MSKEYLLRKQKLTVLMVLAVSLLSMAIVPGRNSLWPDVPLPTRTSSAWRPFPMSRQRVSLRNWLLPAHLGFSGQMRPYTEANHATRHLA